ncbi:unnamed protein product [Ophioblennius macclurei]
MIAALLLLFAVRALCSDGARSHICTSDKETVCFLPDDFLYASNSVSVELLVGKKLNISLEGFSEYPVCQWSRGGGPVLTINQSYFMITPLLSQHDSGQYNLSCETKTASRFLAVELRVLMRRPTKPQLGVIRKQFGHSKDFDHFFTCTSDGSPKPTIKWSGNRKGENVPSNDGAVVSQILSFGTNGEEVKCCATNDEGQECSQTYDYDLAISTWKTSEISNVTLSPGESLLLRCQVRGYGVPLAWENGGRPVNAPECGIDNEMCITTIKNFGHVSLILFIRSLQKVHGGTYTCKKSENEAKSVYVNVQAEGFLSAQLDESKTLSAHNALSSCLQATVSYHPVLQQCYWETPDKNITKCVREEGVTKHRTVKLCDPLTSGDYKLHLESGGKKQIKTISVCVVDVPKFKRINSNNSIIIETVSLVPANHTWMFCIPLNQSCETDSSWEMIPNTFYTDSSTSCKKKIRRRLSRSVTAEQSWKFCLTNHIGSWCSESVSVYLQPQLLASKGEKPDDNGMLLKVASVGMLLALVVVSMVLMYFIKKKKPQYQPQLQMIQMVGPNDNDYIYINFKDFEYNRKWEFPRENLELGKELGSGAFGMVVHATAYGINKPGVSQPVAVKMLKEKHQSVEKEALMSELKMLTHIGQHVNIVNLLGACTDTGPIYLIFQYCCFGDLLNYLKNNSERYHKSVTDAFNKDRFSSLYHNLQPKKNSRELEAPANNYVPMHGSTTRGQEDIALLTLNSSDVDGYEESEIYESDDQTDDMQALTFDDLLSFAFQVAKGMEFLSAKNCIHRDLAARNVLVTKGRLVKIGDFGLARDIDNDSNYVVRGNVRLPVKWMAPESIFQGMYTMKSDVWAYGILLWEIFSLGVTPYPGMKVDHTFYSMIEKGFKMEAPYYANDSVYKMMCNCWALDPCNRPAFSKLVEFMCSQLTDREEKLYHNMLDVTSSDYQNLSTILDISALTQRDKDGTPSANNYCQPRLNDDRKMEETPDVVETEKELLKQSDTE